MKKILLLFVISLVFAACGGNSKENEAKEKAKLDSIVKAEKQRTADSIISAQITEEQNKKRIEDSINAVSQKPKSGATNYSNTNTKKTAPRVEEKKNLQIDKSGGIRFGQPGN